VTEFGGGWEEGRWGGRSRGFRWEDTMCTESVVAMRWERRRIGMSG
jgi:hypothetical protein